MEHLPFFESEYFKWVILPILIFCARIMDVSIGTIRIVFVSKSHKFLSALLGFFEVLIWLIAIGQIMQNLTNIVCYIAYGGGFAAGNVIGLLIEEKLAMGVVLIRIITRKDASKLVQTLKNADYGVTRIPAEGLFGKVDVIYTLAKRADIKNVEQMIKKFNPRAFYSIEDVKFVSEGSYPLKLHPKKSFFKKFRKSQKER